MSKPDEHWTQIAIGGPRMDRALWFAFSGEFRDPPEWFRRLALEEMYERVAAQLRPEDVPGLLAALKYEPGVGIKTIKFLDGVLREYVVPRSPYTWTAKAGFLAIA